MHPDTDDVDTDDVRTMTMEAFADTIVPGEKRWPQDRAIAGAASGPGAVAAGALELMGDPASGFAPALESFAMALNAHAGVYAQTNGLSLDASVPAFVALSYPDRTRLLQQLLTPGHPEKEMWVGLALFSNMAFDSAAHLDTHEAFAADHPGLLTIGYFRPGPDGFWRFPEYSYGRPLAALHPNTTPTGSPA